MIGVILAGGASRRMGHDKAQVEVAGRPMVEWVVSAMREVCEDVVLAGSRETPAGLTCLPDPGTPHRGPLAGLVAALHEFPGRHLGVVAVDQPWIRVETMRRLGNAAGGLAVVPVDGGVRQTTCAVYPPGLVATAEAELAGGGSMQSLLDVASFAPVVDWASWGEDGRSWFSVDTPEAIDEALRRFGDPGGLE